MKTYKCCSVSSKKKGRCTRKDGKIFSIPRRFTRKRCLKGVKGFTMKSSCAPYKFCKTRKYSRRNKKKHSINFRK